MQRLQTSEKQSQLFGESLLHSFENVPASVQSKAELELAIFRAYVVSGLIGLSSPDFEIAQKLQMTTSKVSSLKYRLRLAEFDPSRQLSELAKHIYILRLIDETQSLVIRVDEEYYRQQILALLHSIGRSAERSLSKDHLEIRAADLQTILTEIPHPEAKELMAKMKSNLREQKVQNLFAFAKNFAASATIEITTQSIARILGL